jgi:hypothetical protein
MAAVVAAMAVVLKMLWTLSAPASKQHSTLRLLILEVLRVLDFLL